MAKLIPLDDAAKLLGLSPEELNNLRSRGELRAYRDGSSWKFKMDELERYASMNEIDLAVGPAGGVPQSAGDSGIDGDLEELIDMAEIDDLELETDDDSVLQEEQESGDGGGSTVVGKEKPTGDSDLHLVADSDEGSDVKLMPGSDVAADDEAAVDDDELQLEAASDVKLTDGDELALDEDDLAPASTGSALDLDADSDDNLVLGSGVGSDITLDPGESGINLNPADSGLSLEEPLELAGSGVESLELGEDDMIDLEQEAEDPDAATQLKADDDFLLTAVDEDGEEDSGSQVIALDTEEFDDSAGAMFDEDAESLVAEDADLGAAAGTEALAAPAAPEVVEAPYTVWNVLFLLLIVVFLCLAGMMVADLLRNMWSWNQPYTANSSLMDKIVEMVGG